MAPPRRPRPKSSPYDLIAYSVAAVSLAAGVFLLVLRPAQVPPQARWTMAILLILMGIYRIVHTRSRANHRKWEEEFAAFQEEEERNRPTEL